MRLIDIDKLEFHYGGLAQIAPDDFAGTANYFMEQVESQPTIDAIPTEYIRSMAADPDCAGSKSRILSWLLRIFEEARHARF